MTNQENEKSNDKVIEFLIEDYKLKVDYLNNRPLYHSIFTSGLTIVINAITNYLK